MNALKRIRKKTGLTQVQAARLIGVSRRTYQIYEEKGKINDMYNEVLTSLKNKGLNEKWPALLTIKSIKATCSEIFAKYPQVQCAYLFGSYARDEATENSDVDLLIVAPQLKGFNFASLHHDLRAALKKDVDLVNHTTLLNSEKMLRDLMIQGVKIYGQRTSAFKN